MSVEDWARREAIKEYGVSSNVGLVNLRDAHADGIVRAFDALLSDEVTTRAATDYWKASMEDLDLGEEPTAEELEQFVWATRIVLQAAVRAVTEGGGNA